MIQLTKENIVQVNFSESILTQNFRLIESEFRKLTSKIEKLTKQSNILVQKINEIDPYDQIDNWMRDFSTEKQMNQKEGAQQTREKNSGEPGSMIDGNDQEQSLNKAITGKNKLILKKNQDAKQGAIQDEQKSSKGNNYNDRFSKESKSLKAMHESLIRNLDERVTALQEDKQREEDRIIAIEKENQKIKGFLGMKKKEKTSKSINKGSQKHKRSSIKESISNQEINDGQRNGEESAQGTENMLQENNFITSFSKQIQVIKQILRDKSLLIDEHFDKLSSQILKNKDSNQEEIKTIFQKIHEIQQKDKDLQLLAPQQKCTRSNHTSNSFTRNTKSSLDMNQTVESYKNYYEDKIVQIFEEMDRIKGEYTSLIDKLNDDSNEQENCSSNQRERMKNIALRIGKGANTVATDQKTKKQLNSVKRQVKKIKEEFDYLMGGINTGSNETRTFIIKPNQNKQDWKNLSQKIFKTKQELMGYIKDLQSKIFTNNQIISLAHELEIGLSQCKILINKKVSSNDFQKTSKRIQNRLNNFIKQIYEKQGMSQEQQALLSKQPWFCLSCDTEIKNPTGKLGKTLYNDRLMGKKVNPESHMVRRIETASKLPTLHY